MTQPGKPRIDFYKLSSHNRNRVNRFCCQLADKVVKMGNSVFVRTKDAAETQLLDDMLWTFNDSSFLPHAVVGDSDSRDVPVIIGHGTCADTGYLLINLADELPDNISGYERIAEIIDEVPQNLQQGRARYSAYKKAAYDLHYHEIPS